MNRKLMLSLAGAAAALFMAVGAAQAGPASGTLGTLKLLGQDAGTQHNVLWTYRCHRRCYRHRGYHRCRRVCRNVWWF